MKNRFFDFQLFAVPDTLKWSEQCSGQGRKKVLVLYEEATAAESLQQFLGRVFKAVKLDIQQDLFLCPITPGIELSLSQFPHKEKVDRVIVFGLPSGRLGLRFPLSLYEILEHRGKQYLLVDDLREIMEERQRGEKQKAAALWQCLQALFPKRID